MLTESDRTRLLFSHRQVQTIDEPYFAACIDNYLPEHIYDELLLYFPDQLIPINYDDRCRLRHPDQACRDLWSKVPVCRDLFEFLTSDRFLKDLNRWIMPALQKHRGEYGERDWVYADEWPVGDSTAGSKYVNVTFKFSRMTEGESLPPHTDESSKLLSLVLHFADPEWRESYGGSTEVYVPKHRLLRNNWHDIYAPIELMRLERTYRFLPNRLLVILKSRNSWHGVSPLTCPAHISRKTLLITIHDKERSRGPRHSELFRRALTRCLLLLENSRRSRLQTS